MFRITKLAAVCFTLFGGSAFAAVPIINNSSSTTTAITISGSNLSGGTAVVTLGSYAPLAVTAQSATQLVAALPAGVSAGSYTLNVQIGSSKTNSTSSVATIGAVGPVGPAGPTGAAGPAGAQGAAGPTGATGPQGQQGNAGPAGVQGPIGATGAVGPQGQQGPAGPTGAQGVKGDTGAVGPQGAVGATGPQGIAGPQGPVGPAGGPALQLYDAHGTIVGSLYGTGNTSGQGLVVAKINGERVIVPFGWGNPGNPGPDLGLGTTGYVAFTSSDCSGTPYIVNGWSMYPGASKPSALYQSTDGGFVIYIPSTTTTQTFDSGSVYYGGPPYGSNSNVPTCYLSQNSNVQGVPVDTAPISLNWSYPFSLQ